MQLFVDMDGVLADFDKGYNLMIGSYGGKSQDNVNWKAVADYPDFFVNLPPMPDFDRLWNAVKIYTPTILTGIPTNVPGALGNKLAWIRKYIGHNTNVIGCPSRDKCKYGKPGDILIDDWEKWRHLWIAMGGVWITHTSADDSVKQLQEHLYG